MSNPIAALLLDVEIKPSYQRLKVMEFVSESNEHPTVEKIFSALKPEIPTLSKATVYNTLKLFEEKNLIRSVTIEDNEVRYDAVVEEHGHFKCDGCGVIIDFPVQQKEETSTALEGCAIRQKDVFYHGFCSDCSK